MNEKDKREFLTRLKNITEWNKHDLGELGEFIRTEYVYGAVHSSLVAWVEAKKKEWEEEIRLKIAKDEKRKELNDLERI